MDDETKRVLNAVGQWLDIRGRYRDSCPTRADVHHSALLARLLEGKDPQRDPPPVRYSYPWYDLVEKGRDEAGEIWEWAQDGQVTALVIDQSLWRIVEKVSDAEWLVAYCYEQHGEFKVHPSLWRARREPRPHLPKAGTVERVR